MHSTTYSEIMIAFGGTFVLSLMLTFLVRSIALKIGWVSIPREERWSKRVVALMGGISVYVSFTVLFFYFDLLIYLPVWVGSTVMFLTGFWDDRFELKPLLKFLLQFFGASLLIIYGYSLIPAWPFWISIPLTYFWIVGITNALNMLDNMDGLAGGTAVIVALVFAMLAFKLGSTDVGLIGLILAGAVAGFLVLNYHPAKIFMGDSGSLFIGYMMAAMPMLFSEQLMQFGSFTVLPIVVAVSIMPIFDTSLVTFLRIFKGRSPSQGGADHSSHRLVFAGLTEKVAVHVLYLISILFGGIVIVFYPDNALIFYLLLSSGLVGLLYFGLYLSRLDVYGTTKPSRIESLLHTIPASLKSKIHLILILADIVLIVVAFTLAFILRFEIWSDPLERTVFNVLPVVIVIKVFTLAVFGVYRSVWRYAGVSDLINLFLGVIIGASLSGMYVYFFNGHNIESVSVYVIDALLFFTFISASRFALKALSRLINTSNKGQRHVILYGAGDTGWLALNEIRQNYRLNIKPIGFVDDSPYKMNGNIQGLKIFGSFEELGTILVKQGADELLITTNKLPEDRYNEIMRICEVVGVNCRVFSTNFEKIVSSKSHTNGSSYT
jgi:UDP-GlcNAc:undecaprenyl-phosphate/decaprenyl-phosphate GlcNAc-1-phosphate transferase